MNARQAVGWSVILRAWSFAQAFTTWNGLFTRIRWPDRSVFQMAAGGHFQLRAGEKVILVIGVGDRAGALVFRVFEQLPEKVIYGKGKGNFSVTP
jgi:hypothetical protein